MKSIEFITATVAKMQEIGIPANIEIGTFKVSSNGSLFNWAGNMGKFEGAMVSFRLEFKPSHIQHLLDMGVKIDFQSVVMANLSPKALRFKSGREAIKQGDYAPYYYEGNPANQQTGVVENWLWADATCTPGVLAQLDKYCRDNHRDQVAMHNNTVLAGAGWQFKVKYSSHVPIESQYKNIKAIRNTQKGKKANQLLPIQKRVLKLI